MIRAERAQDAGTQARVRIDKWLWAARFYKTRSLASDAIEAGQVRIGDERIKPARAVHVGERITIRKSGYAWDVEVTALSDRRGSASEAATLYRETAESIEAREREIARRKAAATDPQLAARPTKRNRRKLEDFLNEP